MNWKTGKKLTAMTMHGKLKRYASMLVAVYVILTVSFYFLAGDQLRLRQSRGNLELLAAEAGTVELSVGNVIEQQFTVEIQRLKTIDVQWGTYYRPNSGTAMIELFDQRDGSVLMSGIFDMAQIPEGGLTTLTADEPLEGLYEVPLLLRITSPDAQPGSAVSPLMNLQPAQNSTQLFINAGGVEGTLCFAAKGEDYIWTGLHYWKFVAAGGVLLLLGIGMVWYRYSSGKHSVVINALEAVQKYRFLIEQLVSRDFKTKYKRSVLGVFWSFLNPLLMMTVQYFVFSTIFKSDIPNYAVYLLIGIVSFNFFSEACGMSLVWSTY